MKGGMDDMEGGGGEGNINKMNCREKSKIK